MAAIIQGRIIKGIGGFYYVHTADGLFECKARGVFRNDHCKPLVGDFVRMEILSPEDKLGNIIELLPRKSELIRPAVANVDQALIIFALASPTPTLNLLDRFLIMMEQQEMDVIVCFNKLDLVPDREQKRLQSIYEKAGYRTLLVSAKESEGIELLRRELTGRCTTVAGPSGVGKSSLLNALMGEEAMQTGEVSEKIDRGRHTTRHSEVFVLDDDTILFDTPGFSSLDIGRSFSGGRSIRADSKTAAKIFGEMEAGELWQFFPEMREPEKSCRFIGCSHLNEPDCGVREALKAGEISEERYENYRLLYEELKSRRRY